MVGASHTARLANVFEDMGAIVVDLSIPGWRISSEAVSSMLLSLSSALAEEFEGETVVFYQLFDNSIFLMRNDDISSLPEKGPDGRYHVVGRLEIADRDKFRSLFTEILPLLRAGLDHHKYILSPLLRYVVKACCKNPLHITNKREGDFLQKQVAAFSEIQDWLNAMTFTRRIRNFLVINPVELLGPDDLVECTVAVSKYYREDPVHMTAEGYIDMGQQLIEKIGSSSVNGKTTETTNEEQSNQIDWAARRSRWVHENDTTVRRADTDGSRGRGQRGRWPPRARGHQGKRGGYRGWGGRGKKFSPY
jgi:hypothetical protein